MASFCFCLIQHLSHDLLANKKWINGTNNNINNGVPGTNTGNMGIQQKWDLIEQKWDITRNEVINPTSDAHSWTAQTYHRHFNIGTVLYGYSSGLKVKRTKANKCNGQAPICTPAACDTKTHCPALRSHVEHIQRVSATIHCPGSTLAVFSSFGHLEGS